MKVMAEKYKNNAQAWAIIIGCVGYNYIDTVVAQFKTSQYSHAWLRNNPTSLNKYTFEMLSCVYTSNPANFPRQPLDYATRDVRE